MKSLQSNEKYLALILGALVITIGGLLLLKFSLNLKTQLSKQKSLLEVQLQQARLLTQESEDWIQREEWLSSHIPTMADDATAKLMEEIAQKTKGSHVEISQQQLSEPATQGEYREVSVQFTAKASMESLMKWLSGIEQFSEFRYLKKLDLKKNERGDMTANIVVAIKGKPTP